MFSSFFLSRKWAVWAYLGGAALLLSLIAQVQMTVLINEWYEGFYNVLQNAAKTPIDKFWDSIVKFCWIAFPYVILVTVTNYLARVYALRWREAITFDYLPRWRSTTSYVEGASQRLQEDAMKFASIVESLGLRIVRELITLISFVPVLWVLSKHITFGPLANIPGSLVWLALVLSVGGMFISWFVGWWLPGLEYNNQKVEHAFRKELVYGEDNVDRRSHIELFVELFTGIRFNYHRLFLHYTYFDVWLTLYSQALIILPYVVIAPGMFTAGLSLGLLMRMVNAFKEVREGLMVLVYNWTKITELRSVYKRLKEFERNLAPRTA